MVLHLLEFQFTESVASIHLWRTQHQAEVDFVVNLGHTVLPVEIKSVQLKKTQIERSLRSFIADYQPPEAWVVNLSLKAEMQVEQTRVRFLPWSALLQKN